MFGKLPRVQQPGKPIAVDAAVAVGQEAPEDLRFERLERRCAIDDLFEGVANLIVCEAVRALRVRD